MLERVSPIHQTGSDHFYCLVSYDLQAILASTNNIALSILQNGNLPQFLEPSLVTDLFDSDDPSPVAGYLRKGMEMLGLYQVGNQFPIFQHLLRPSNVPLRFKRFTGVLKPIFSEDGSNRRTLENMLYMEFLKYAREAASGRRGAVTLNSILQFTTGADEEPVLGFSVNSQIAFPETISSFIPTANTCINRLNLPRHSIGNPLPPRETLFNMYDYAFSNSYYGLQ